VNISLIPRADDVDVYIVLDQLRDGDPVWREIHDELANEPAIIEWLIEGQFDHPLRVVAFNSAEGWSRDVTEDVALKLLAASREGRVLGSAARDFVERVTGQTATLIA
jgi:hypothetical protein